MSIIPWTDIEALYNIKKFVQAYPENLQGNPAVTYKGKVKLHGTNAGIQVYGDGKVIAQSRTTELHPWNDNYGFATWVNTNLDKWSALVKGTTLKLVVFGEWCGPGIQSGVSVSNLNKKIFAVFAIKISDDADGSSSFAIDPGAIESIVQGIPDTYTLPWYDEVVIDYSKSDEELKLAVDKINESVNAVEENDPWVDATFGVKGTGEGLVYYPVSKEHEGWDNFKNLVFKAKGEKHRVVKAATPTQLNAEVASSIDEFVTMFVTEPRLEQGVSAVSADGTVDNKLIGKFLAWFVADVQKESADELEASKLDWKQVQKPVSDKARGWYLAKIRG